VRCFWQERERWQYSYFAFSLKGGDSRPQERTGFRRVTQPSESRSDCLRCPVRPHRKLGHVKVIDCAIEFLGPFEIRNRGFKPIYGILKHFHAKYLRKIVIFDQNPGGMSLGTSKYKKKLMKFKNENERTSCHLISVAPREERVSIPYLVGRQSGTISKGSAKAQMSHYPDRDTRRADSRVLTHVVTVANPGVVKNRCQTGSSPLMMTTICAFQTDSCNH